jgi:hypothetical protein
LLAKDVPAFAEYYDRDEIWSKESLARREALRPQIEAYQASRLQY